MFSKLSNKFVLATITIERSNKGIETWNYTRYSKRTALSYRKWCADQKPRR